jgi:hypothetical protein
VQVSSLLIARIQYYSGKDGGFKRYWASACIVIAELPAPSRS